VRIYTGRRLAPPDEAITALERIASLKVLAGPVIGLPDLHCKPQLECPSSVATAMREHVVLGLSSPSPNCGMALARTHLHVTDMDDGALDLLFGELIQRLPVLRQSPVISLDDMTSIMLRGGAAAVGLYGLDSSTLDHMDQRGNALCSSNVESELESVLQAVPRLLRELGARDFAQIGRGNHFLELQVVEELHDEQIAHAWGLEEDTVVAMYHADSGRVGGLAGRLYAHRRKNSWRGRLYEWRIKLPFHVSAGRLSHMPHRVYYHVLPRRMAPLPANSEEAQQTLVALQAASNYAYANRVAVLASLGDAMSAVWGEGCDVPALLWDAPHNSIRKEQIGGESYWVHRHNAARALPPSLMSATSPFVRTGHPVLLPGMDYTSSYVCVAGEGATHTLHSVNHGAGHSALQLGRPLDNGAATRLYAYESGFVGLHPHLSDDGPREVLEVLRVHDIARPVARLRPLAVLKGRA